jgi:predicted MFS family arabinose efflux permease
MAENVSHHLNDASVWKETVHLLKMKNFMLLCFAFCILYGASSTIGLVMSPVLNPYGYTSFFISMGAILCVVCGVIASILVGMFLDRTKKYLLTLRIEAWLAAFCFLMTIWIIPLHNDPLTLIFLILAGVAAVPITPLGFVFSIELTHPF